MSSAGVRAPSISYAMNTERKGELPEKEAQDPLDNVLRHAIGRDPFFSFSRASDGPVQWIPLLHALDQQGNSRVSDSSKLGSYVERKEDRPLELCNGLTSTTNEPNDPVHSLKDDGIPMKWTRSTSEQMQALKISDAVAAFAQAAAKANDLPGWPLLSPSMVQLQKCDKCSREFCSSINYRRHIRVHRRLPNTDKGFPKNRDYMSAFWDKLTVDEAKEIVSLSNVGIEGVNGSSIVRALSSWIYKPCFSSLPQPYVKAGNILLDVVQAKPSRLRVSSTELFNVLDDASEKTFLCADPECSQKFLFDGEAGKIALEMKNLIACTSFLLEQKLVKAWFADRDAEALRCQKLLMEEEEAAQKRQAELTERKRMKKLRLKEQKFKDVSVDIKVSSPGLVEDAASSSSMRSPRVPAEPDSNSLGEHLPLDPGASLDPEAHHDSELLLQSKDIDENLDNKQSGSDLQQPIASRHLLKSARRVRNGYNSGSNAATKSSALLKHANYKDPKAVTLANGHKVWARKTKPENEESVDEKGDFEDGHHQALSEDSEVLIGSISVALEDSSRHEQGSLSARSCHFGEMLASSDSSLDIAKHSTVKQCRPVGHAQNGAAATRSEKKEKHFLSRTESKLDGGIVEDSFEGHEELTGTRCTTDSQGPVLFSSKDAAAFLAQRWNEAIAADNVELVLPPETEASDCPGTPEGGCTEAPELRECSGRSILCSSEDQMGGVGSVELAPAVSKPKFRPKPEENGKLRYFPKQRNNV